MEPTELELDDAADIKVLEKWTEKAETLEEWQDKMVSLLEHPRICTLKVNRMWGGSDKPSYFQIDCDLDMADLSYFEDEDIEGFETKGDTVADAVTNTFDLVLEATQHEIDGPSQSEDWDPKCDICGQDDC